MVEGMNAEQQQFLDAVTELFRLRNEHCAIGGEEISFACDLKEFIENHEEVIEKLASRKKLERLL